MEEFCIIRFIIVLSWILKGRFIFLIRCKLLILGWFLSIRNNLEVVLSLILFLVFWLCFLVMVILIIFKIELFFLLINLIVGLKILFGEIIYLFLLNSIRIGLVDICVLLFLFLFRYRIVFFYFRVLWFMRGFLFLRYFWRVEVYIEFLLFVVIIRLFLKIIWVCYFVIFCRLKLWLKVRKYCRVLSWVVLKVTIGGLEFFI